MRDAYLSVKTDREKEAREGDQNKRGQAGLEEREKKKRLREERKVIRE